MRSCSESNLACGCRREMLFLEGSRKLTLPSPIVKLCMDTERSILPVRPSSASSHHAEVSLRLSRHLPDLPAAGKSSCRPCLDANNLEVQARNAAKPDAKFNLFNRNAKDVSMI